MRVDPSARMPGLFQSLPGHMLRPFALLPFGLSGKGFALVCNRVFASALAAGELDFLAARVLRLDIRDAALSLRLSVDEKGLVDPGGHRRDDVCIGGTAFTFLQLVSGREDPDTLFFQRRLRIDGDTELGLHVKNFLDAWEPPADVRGMQRMLAVVIEKLSAQPRS